MARIAKAGSVTLLFLALIELGLRIVGPDIFAFVIASRRVHRYSPQWKVDLMPDAVAHLWLPGSSNADPLYNFIVTTDGDGQRTHDRRRDHPSPAPDTRYVHAIGDSFTMGWGVDYTSSYPALLEAMLPPPYRVLNQGVDGFGTLAATEKSMASWDRFPASHVVYLFSANDVTDDETALAIRERSVPLQRFWHAYDMVRRHSYLANVPFALHWNVAFRGRHASSIPSGERLRLDAPARSIVVTPDPAVTSLDEPTPSMKQIGRYHRFVTGHGARLTVLAIAGSPESVRFHRHCEQQGMDVHMIDVPAEWRLTDDGHFNAMGNYAVARLARDLVLQ